jgi:signal transduction histidine kinase
MPNSIHIFLLEPNSETRKQITDSLVATDPRFEITETRHNEIRALFSSNLRHAVLIFSEKEISPELLPDLLAEKSTGLICLLEAGELSVTGRILKTAAEIRTIGRNQTEMAQLPEIIRELVARKIRRIMLDYFFNENKTSTMGRLLSGFAHNMSAPLTGILGYAEIIRSAHPEIPEIQHIIEQTKRVDLILRTLVIKNMRLEEKNENLVDLNELLKNEIDFLQANLTFKHEISKKFEFAERLPKLQATYPDISQCVAAFLLFCISTAKNSTAKKVSLKTSYDEKHIILELGHSGQVFPIAEFTELSQAENVFSAFIFSDRLAEWLNQNFMIFLAYHKLISIPAVIQTRRTPAGEELIRIEFQRNKTTH